jgi:hypothetical protein
MQEIRNCDPISRRQRIKITIIATVLTSLLAFLIGGWLISLIMFLLLPLLMLLGQLSVSIYDGWTLYDSMIELKTIPLFGKVTCQKINYSDITRITYFEGQGRAPRYIEFKTKKGIYKLSPRKNIFELAGTLKFLQSKNIDVKLAERDHEIELFLQGKIDSVPMTNDMVIKNLN